MWQFLCALKERGRGGSSPFEIEACPYPQAACSATFKSSQIITRPCAMLALHENTSPFPETDSRELCEVYHVMVWCTETFPGDLNIEVIIQVVFSTLLKRREGCAERTLRSRLFMGSPMMECLEVPSHSQMFNMGVFQAWPYWAPMWGKSHVSLIWEQL